MISFNRTQKFTKTNIAKVSGAKAIVYKIKNVQGKNLYTGVASRGRGPERLLEHKEIKKELIPGGTRFQVAQVKNREIANKIEKRIIKQEKPEYNQQNK